MLKIGDFSKLSRVSIRMLRYYDKIGILVPEHIDDISGYRHYSEAQLPIVNRITALKDMGFHLAVIADILKNYSDTQAFKKYLMIRRTEMLDQAERTKKQLLLLETTIKRLGEDENIMKYNVTLKELPQRYVASLRGIISAYDQEGTLWHKMTQQMASQHVQIANPCHSLAIFYDKEFKESDVDVEVQLTVQGNYKNAGDVIFKQTEPISYASATFKGGYELITEVNEAVANWIADNHYEFNGPMFNIYHVGPNMDRNPDHWVTEVCYPVKKK